MTIGADYAKSLLGVIIHSGLGSTSSHPQSSLNIEVKKLVKGRLTINEI